MKSILAIISNTDHLVNLSSLLAGRGYCVIAKSDASSALSTLREGVDIDVVIADYMLSDMETVDFFNLLKQATAAPPPVILLSDHVHVQDYLNALSLGAFEFLFRPVHPREFLRIVNIATRRRTENQGGAESSGGSVPRVLNSDSRPSVSLSLF